MLKQLGRTVLIAAALAACNDPASPEPDPPATVVGVYELRSIAGVSLPAPYAVSTTHTARLMSGVLTLHEGGTGTWVDVTEETLGGPTHETTSTLTWTLAGAMLSITIDCSGLGSCIAGPHFVGTVTDTEFTVTESPLMRLPLVLELVSAGT